MDWLAAETVIFLAIVMTSLRREQDDTGCLCC